MEKRQLPVTCEEIKGLLDREFEMSEAERKIVEDAVAGFGNQFATAVREAAAKHESLAVIRVVPHGAYELDIGVINATRERIMAEYDFGDFDVRASDIMPDSIFVELK